MSAEEGPKSLLDIISQCAAIATVADDAWERERAREALRNAVEATEETIPQGSHRDSWLMRGTLLPSLMLDQTIDALGAKRIVWTGAPGAGKTTLAVAAMREWVRRLRTPGMFITADKLGRARMDHRLGAGEAELVKAAISVPLLVLDDLGMEGDISPIRDVIRERFSQSRATWITTGLGNAELIARYDGGTMRRMFEPPTTRIAVTRSVKGRV